MPLGFSPLYQNKLQEQETQDVLNICKVKFKPYGDLVDQTFSQFGLNYSINNQDPHSKIENDKTAGIEYPKKDSHKLLQVPTLGHKYYNMMKLQKGEIL